jgi:hypothetical protein
VIGLVAVQSKSTLRLLAFVAAVLWTAALFAPFYDVAFYDRDTATVAFVFGTRLKTGWWLALWGWLGPFVFAPGWFANIPLAKCLARMLTGREPRRQTASAALIIAATALLPHGLYDFTMGNFLWSTFQGPAIWIWLGAFAVVWITSIYVTNVGAPE